MIIKNILKTACLFLGKENLIEKLELEDLSTLNEKEKSEIAFLIRCLNLVYSEVATDYLPLLHKERMTISDGKIELSSLTKKLLEVVSIKDENGYKLKFKNYSSYIQVDAEVVEILYKFLPTDLEDIDDQMENFSGKITEKIFAYGVAMECCFIQGLFEDASIWEKRFKDALSLRMGKKSNIKLPSRRWN